MFFQENFLAYMCRKKYRFRIGLTNFFATPTRFNRLPLAKSNENIFFKKKHTVKCALECANCYADCLALSCANCFSSCAIWCGNTLALSSITVA